MKNETTLRRQLSVSEETTEASHQPLGALEELHRHWALFLSVGVALMALGIVATLTAGLSTIVAVDFFGWILVIAGAGVTIHAFWAKRWSGFFLQLLSGLLYLAAGWMLATHGELSDCSDTRDRHLVCCARRVSHRRGIEHADRRLGLTAGERDYHPITRADDLERMALVGGMGDRSLRRNRHVLLRRLARVVSAVRTIAGQGSGARRPFSANN